MQIWVDADACPKAVKEILYRADEKSGEYAHPSTIIFCMPDGRISMYMDDVVFKPKDLRLALVEASQGAIGSPLDQLALFLCFQYDPDSSSYKVAAWKVMRSGAMLTLMTLAGGLAMLWWREARGKMTHRASRLAAVAGGREP